MSDSDESETEMDRDNLPIIKQEIATLVDAISQVLEMYERDDRKKTNVFSVDNSLVEGYVKNPNVQRNNKAKLYSREFDRNIDFVGRRTFSLFNEYAATTPYIIAFSEPTIIEIESAAQRHSDQAKSIIKGEDLDSLYEAYMRLQDAGADQGAVKKELSSEKLYGKVESLVEHMSGRFRAEQFKSILELIRTGHVAGLGGFYNSDDFKKVKELIYADTAVMFEYLNMYKGARDFNNFIDALNFSFTYHLNQIHNGVALSYVTPFPTLPTPSINAQRIGVLKSRRTLPASLLTELSARAFSAKGGLVNDSFEDDVRDWVATTFDDAVKCKQYLENAEVSTDVSRSRQRSIKKLYKYVMNPVFKMIDNNKELDSLDIFGSKSDFARRFEQDVDEAEVMKKGLADLQPVIESDELLSDLGLSENPRIRQIRDRIIRNLGRSRPGR